MRAVTDSLPAPDHLRPRGTPRRSHHARWRALVLVTVHLLVLVHLAHGRIAGETLTPLEPSESMETLELGYINAGFLLFTSSILATLVLGRFFCGWACHFVAYQDACNALLRRLGMRPRPLRSRLLVLVPFGIAFYMFVWPSLQRWLGRGEPAPAWQLELTTTGFWDTFAGPVMAVLTILIGGFLVIYWLGAKGFCTYGCPYGAFFAVADRFAPGRIRVSDACGACGQCTAACTSNVQVHREVARYGMVVDSGCMKTMDCVSSCPNEALYYGFRPRGKAANKPRPQRLRRSTFASDVSWPEEALLAGMFVVTLLALRAAYDLVPLLLAVALAVLTAVWTLILVRVLRRREFTVQQRALRRGGCLTRTGKVTLALTAGWLLLVAHTGLVRYHTWRGETLATAAASVAPHGAQPAAFAPAWRHLRRADALGLLPDGELQLLLGIVAQRRGALDAADHHLRASLSVDPDAAGARVRLAEVTARRGESQRAEAMLRELLEARPNFALAQLRLADLLALRGAWPEAEQQLVDLLQRHPDHADAQARLERLRRR